MIKELKYLTYVIFISIFLFLTIKYYLSDNNKKKSYRSFNLINEKIEMFSNQLPILENDTKNIIEYVENTKNKKKKKYNFWKLLEK
tara:strand:- start:1525 stop:1782 length:258 start_codon:yes stop_codon:yes gene_type:complete